MTPVSIASRRGLASLLLLVAGLALMAGCGGSPESNALGDASTNAETSVDGSSEADTAQADGGLPDGGGDADTGANVDAAPVCPWSIAGTLTLPSAMVTGTLRGPSRNTTTSCTADLGTQGPDAFYVLNVTTRTGVILQTTGLANTVLAIRSVCDDPITEVACNHNGMLPNAYLRTILDPGTYYVVVDVYAFGIGGNYTLSLTSFAAPPNGICTDAIAVTDGSKVMGDLSTSVPSNVPSCSGGPLPPGGITQNVLYYRAKVPASARLLATLPATAPGPAFQLSVLDGCASSTCLAGGYGRVAYANDGASARDVIIAVSSGGAPPPPPGVPPFPMTFELDVSIQSLASNATCAAASPVSTGATVMGDTSLGGADTMTPCLTAGPNGTVSGPLWYSTTVPAGSALLVNAQTIDPSPIVAGVVDGCGTGAACLAPTSSGPIGPMGPGQLRYANPSMNAQAVEFFVGHTSFGPGGRVSVSTSIATLAANAACTSATPLTDGVPVTGNTAGGSSVTLPCVNGSSGVLYYSITIPAGMTLGVETQPSGPSLAILDSCSSSLCLGSFTGGPVASATFTNSSTSPRPVIVAVAAGFGGGGAFTLTAALRGPPTNTTCSAATPVTDGTTLTFQDGTAGVDNLSSRCIPSDTSGVLYYSATIGAGQLLTATATGLGAKPFPPSIRILASCSAATCLATSNPMFPASAVSYLNTGNSPTSIIIAVGAGAMFGPPGLSGYFDLSVSIR
jgi:hypothetical protein